MSDKCKQASGTLKCRLDPKVGEETLRDYVGRCSACGRMADTLSTSTVVLQSLGLSHDGWLTNAADVLFSRPRGMRLRQGAGEPLPDRDLRPVPGGGTVFDLACNSDLYNVYCHMDWTIWDSAMVDISSPGWFFEEHYLKERLSGRSRSSLTRGSTPGQDSLLLEGDGALW